MTIYYVGDVLLINNGLTEKQFDILSADSGSLQLLDSVMGISSTQKINEISELILSGKAKLIPRDKNQRKQSEPLSADFSTYSEDMKSESRRRYSYVSDVIKQGISIYTEKTLLPVIESVSLNISDEKSPSWRTLCRWLKAFHENGNSIRGLVPQNRLKGNKTAKIDPRIELYIEQAIAAYKRAENPSISAIYRELETSIHYDNSLSEDNKLNVPSLVTLTKRIQESAPYELYAARNGKRAARVEFKLNQSAPKTAFILQRAEIDHTLLDIFVVDSENRMLLGRPWITSIIDKHSRCILGSHIGFEPPSYLSVAKALRNAILPKKSLLNHYPSIKNDWPCFGIPSVLVSDRGKEFESVAFVDACQELNISIQRCPAKHPWYKGAIESFFKTINQRLLSGMFGSVLSKLQSVTEYDPAKYSILSLDAFIEIFYIWIVDIYHQSPAADNTLIPILEWKKSLEHVVITPMSPERLNLVLSENKEVQITKAGIKIDYIVYDCEELLRYRMKYGFSKALVKYDRDDLGLIFVFDKHENKYFSFMAINQDYTKGLSLYQHKLIKRFAKKYISENVDQEALAQAKTRINKIIEDEVLIQKQSVGTKKVLSRFMGIQQADHNGEDKTSLIRTIKDNSTLIPRPEQGVSQSLPKSPVDSDYDFSDEYINDLPDDLDFGDIE